MNPDRWLAVLSVVVSCVVTWVVSRKYTDRANTLRAHYRRTSLEPQRPVPGFAQTFDGMEIDRPHHFELSVVNAGPRDIGPDDFAGGECYFEVGGSEFLAIIENPPGRQFDVVALDGGVGFRLALSPCLIPKGERAHVSVICSGRPAPQSQRVALRNVRVVKPNSQRWSNRRVHITAFALASPFAIAYVASTEVPFAKQVWGAAMFTLFGGMVPDVLMMRAFGRRQADLQHGALWD